MKNNDQKLRYVKEFHTYRIRKWEREMQAIKAAGCDVIFPESIIISWKIGYGVYSITYWRRQFYQKILTRPKLSYFSKKESKKVELIIIVQSDLLATTTTWELYQSNRVDFVSEGGVDQVLALKGHIDDELDDGVEIIAVIGAIYDSVWRTDLIYKLMEAVRCKIKSIKYQVSDTYDIFLTLP